MLARDIALNAKGVDLDKDLLEMIVNRMLKERHKRSTFNKIFGGKQY